jgi:hypothetical protein
MQKPQKESDIMRDTIELLMSGTQLTVWSREDGTPFPNLNDETNPDDPCPEEYVTKQFWKNKYEGIEQRRNELG